MKPFPGFPKNVQFAGLPKLFFTELLPHIDDIAELKVSVLLLRALYEKKGYPRFLVDSDLLSDRTLMSGIGGEDALRRGLELAVKRGTVLSLTLEREGKPVQLYFLNTESDHETRDKIEHGEIELGGLSTREIWPDVAERPNIFTLYEENIGMLTPMIGEELKDAERLYPASWIEDAFKEAVSLNKRNWRYIEAILKHWESEGKGHGESGRDSKADTDKYIKGKYGHLVKRRID